jgi:hypothetical protein
MMVLWQQLVLVLVLMLVVVLAMRVVVVMHLHRVRTAHPLPPGCIRLHLRPSVVCDVISVVTGVHG